VQTNYNSAEGKECFYLRPWNTCRRVYHQPSIALVFQVVTFLIFKRRRITCARDPDHTALKTSEIARLVTISLHVEVTSLHLTPLLNSVALMTGLPDELPRNVFGL
jgi:hypothetical protein